MFSTGISGTQLRTTTRILLRALWSKLSCHKTCVTVPRGVSSRREYASWKPTYLWGFTGGTPWILLAGIFHWYTPHVVRRLVRNYHSVNCVRQERLVFQVYLINEDRKPRNGRITWVRAKYNDFFPSTSRHQPQGRAALYHLSSTVTCPDHLVFHSNHYYHVYSVNRGRRWCIRIA